MLAGLVRTATGRGPGGTADCVIDVREIVPAAQRKAPGAIGEHSRRPDDRTVDAVADPVA
jgi:hypothetical protein